MQERLINQGATGTIMNKGVLALIILAILAILAVAAYYAAREPQTIPQKECEGDPNYDECIKMEERGQECFQAPDPQECLRGLGVPIDEAQITITHGTPVPV